MRALFPALVLAAGCVPEPIYAVRRTAVVPHPAPPARSGQPLDRALRLSGHHSTVLVAVEPAERPSANSGLYVSRHNAGAGASFRLGPSLDAGLRLERSLERGAMATGANAEAPGGGATTGSINAMFASALDDGFRVAVGVELGVVVARVREEGRCIESCEPSAPAYVVDKRGAAGVASAALIPSYRAGDWVWFASGTVRNHPTNTAEDREGAWHDQTSDDLRGGPLYVLLGGGVEYRDPSGFTALAQVYQPLSRSVVRYGPAVGLSIGLELGGTETQSARPR
jgi:hypothetical protein